MSAYDYCKHGTYVGGCGIDWMCGACEMGDPDPTLNDLYTELRRALTQRADLLADLLDNGIPTTHTAIAGFLGDLNRRVLYAMRNIGEVRIWASSDDDDNWMQRRHDYYCRDEADDDGPRQYTEIDEIHEYGYVP